VAAADGGCGAISMEFTARESFVGGGA